MHEGPARGSGAVIIWDEGAVEFSREDEDHLSFTLRGQKLNGGFGLTRTGGRRWILVKANDGEARPGSDIVSEQPESVRSGQTLEQLRRDAATRGSDPADRFDSLDNGNSEQSEADWDARR
jgi:bifunctional non-homologous end joining protein LigD